VSRADLSGANLRLSNLVRADLRWSNLSKINLSEADLSNTNLIGSDLSEAYFIDTNLSETKLDGAIVELARFGSNTGMSKTLKQDLIARGAIFEDAPGDRSEVLVPAGRR
jgi:uncharacterized protein YjbI with pentapeptide repeats